MRTPRICLAGKNRIAVDALLFMIAQGWKDRLVVCPNRADDGATDWQPSLRRFATELGVEMVSLEQTQEIEDLVFFSLEYDRILRPAAFRTGRLYNIHFSALPAYKGSYTSALPILNGTSVTGVTLHEIDPGIDTGAIIDQDVFAIPESWTARDLYFSYMARGFDIFCRHFERLMADTAPEGTPQRAAGSSYYSRGAIDYSTLAINPRDTADGLIRQLRAFSFREYQIPRVAGMEIGDWRVLPDRSPAIPGTVLDQGRDHVVIATIDYDLRLERSRVWEWFALEAESPDSPRDSRYVNVSDKSGWTPLIRAAHAGDAALCRRLLAAGADPDRPNPNGTTPLMYALSAPDRARGRSVARLLLDFGADPDRPDRFGRTLDHYHPAALTGFDRRPGGPSGRPANDELSFAAHRS